ncbi:MAG: aminoacetone oxidase family FAD-binding enzyme [Eubacteriales bacterium]|nr:aminoacetone oxidase family FAD-binding enzyme [Eubacteriales bacterium]
MANQPVVFVIGGGASGLAAAISAARAGASVTILEQNDKPGKKILATGNGRCNFTHNDMHPEYFNPDGQSLVSSVLSIFGKQETLEFFRTLGLPSVELHEGWHYPRSLQAASVLEVLLSEARNLKIKIRTGTRVLKVQPAQESFEIYVEGWKYTAESVILCNGSKASNLPGSDGSGYAIAKSLGHRLVTPLPALTGLKGEGRYSWSGVRSHGKIALYLDNQFIAAEEGELQFTEYGLSGIPVFQISRSAIRGLEKGRKCRLTIDLLPDYSEEDLLVFLLETQNNAPQKTREELLIGLLPEKLRKYFVKEQKLSKVSLPEMAKLLKCYSMTIQGYLPFEQAQICSGGVSVTEVDPGTMESRKIPGLYFAGELLDVDGPCGGYNLQWAWSSGFLAGKSAATRGGNPS